jgi:RNA polymerase sigma factor (sigma-70 family)
VRIDGERPAGGAASRAELLPPSSPTTRPAAADRSDAELAVAAAGGDADAFAALHARYLPIALRSARRAARTTPQLEVEEAAALAMTRLWQALPRYDAASPFEPWAAVVVANAVRTAAHAVRTRKAVMNWSAMLAPAGEDGGATPLVERVPGGVAPEEQLVLDEEEQRVRALLARELSPRESAAMRLRLAGWGYADIAARLDTSPKAVDNALRRAVAKLRRALDPASASAAPATAGPTGASTGRAPGSGSAGG